MRNSQNSIPEVSTLLKTLIEGVKAILGSELTGIYLRGSLATGDFEPDRSDIDVLIVTESPVEEIQFSALKQLHAQIASSPNSYGNRLEAAYINRQALRTYQPGCSYPTIGQGEILTWQKHGTNWLLERHILREHGIPLLGPDPTTLIEPVSPEQIRQAAKDRISVWVAWARDEDDPDWNLPLFHKAYCIETMCRILFTAEHGIIASKNTAVQWALQTLPGTWRELIQRSRPWRRDSQVDLSINPKVRAFILWTGAFLMKEGHTDDTNPGSET